MFRKPCRQTGDLSLPDRRQGHSLAPGQDEHVISPRCFPEPEGGAHLPLSNLLPHYHLCCWPWLVLMSAQLWGPGAGQGEEMPCRLYFSLRKDNGMPQQRLRDSLLVSGNSLPFVPSAPDTASSIGHPIALLSSTEPPLGLKAEGSPRSVQKLGTKKEEGTSHCHL